jgi:hypothetical protein
VQQQLQVSHDDGLAMLVDVLLTFLLDGLDTADDLRPLPLGKV